MQTVSSSIWTWATKSLSYDGSPYTMNSYGVLDVCVCVCVWEREKYVYVSLLFVCLLYICIFDM